MFRTQTNEQVQRKDTNEKRPTNKADDIRRHKSARTQKREFAYIYKRLSNTD